MKISLDELEYMHKPTLVMFTGSIKMWKK